jgi:hypothetical protein
LTPQNGPDSRQAMERFQVFFAHPGDRNGTFYGR